MKNGSGSRDTDSTTIPEPAFSQSRWRTAGAVAIVIAGLMAWFGAEAAFLRESVAWYCVYWGIFLAVFITAIAMVILDLRYIRLQYALGKREIFRQTLGDEAFRAMLKEELRRKEAEGDSGDEAPRDRE